MTRSAECSAPFAIVPIDAARDHRLTAMQYRVLIAILSFRNRNSDTCYPSREKLAQRTGYSIANISKVTGALVNLGWLEKDGKGGRSSTTIYRVKVPETVADQATVSADETVSGLETVSELATVAGSDNKTVAGSDTLTVAGLATRIEQTSEQTKEQRKDILVPSVPSGTAKGDYSPAFEAVWADYPQRAGGNSKRDAYKAWAARVKAGADPGVIHAGVLRYAAFLTATGKAGTEFVKQAATFFGPAEHYREPWTAPRKPEPVHGGQVGVASAEVW